MGPFNAETFYSTPGGSSEFRSESQQTSQQSEQTKTPIVENPPYTQYEDSGAASFAPQPVTDPSFQPRVEEVAAPPNFSIPLIALGIGFLFWVMSRD